MKSAEQDVRRRRGMLIVGVVSLVTALALTVKAIMDPYWLTWATAAAFLCSALTWILSSREKPAP